MSFFCKCCGTMLYDGSRFCKKCGSALAFPSSVEEKTPGYLNGDLPSSIIRCADGKLRWTYELGLFSNPVIIILCIKIFFWVLVVIWAFINVISFDNYDYWPETFLSIGKVFLIAIPCVFALVAISYLIYALIMGGKYCTIFEMDDRGINHIQMPKPYKKAHVIGFITSLTGALAGNISATGAGLLSIGRQSMFSKFDTVRRIKALKRKGTIKVNGTLLHNQIYAPPEAFDFVLNFMINRCPKAKL